MPPRLHRQLATNTACRRLPPPAAACHRLPPPATACQRPCVSLAFCSQPHLTSLGVVSRACARSSYRNSLGIDFEALYREAEEWANSEEGKKQMEKFKEENDIKDEPSGAVG